MRRRTNYSLVGDTSQKLYDAYKSKAGKIVEGVLQGALGTTVAAMSAVADDEMLGIHVALGAIWVAFTAKNFAEAGNAYLSKREEDIENLGIEILTHAKLAAQKFQGEESSFTASVNSDLISAISGSLVKNKAPELSQDEIDEINQAMSSVESFQALAEKRSALINSKTLAAAAAVGVLGVTGGVATMALAGSNSAAFNAGIAVTAVGTSLTSISGGLLNAAASNSRSISQEMFERVKALNETKFDLALVEEARSQVKKESAQKNPSSSVEVGGNGAVSVFSIVNPGVNTGRV